MSREVHDFTGTYCTARTATCRALLVEVFNTIIYSGPGYYCTAETVLLFGTSPYRLVSFCLQHSFWSAKYLYCTVL